MREQVCPLSKSQGTFVVKLWRQYVFGGSVHWAFVFLFLAQDMIWGSWDRAMPQASHSVRSLLEILPSPHTGPLFLSHESLKNIYHLKNKIKTVCICHAFYLPKLFLNWSHFWLNIIHMSRRIIHRSYL